MSPQFRNQKQQLTSVFLELKIFYKINENKMSEETVYGMGESPCQIYIWQSVNIARLYRELNKIYTRNRINPVNKQPSEMIKHFPEDVDMFNIQKKNVNILSLQKEEY